MFIQWNVTRQKMEWSADTCCNMSEPSVMLFPHPSNTSSSGKPFFIPQTGQTSFPSHLSWGTPCGCRLIWGKRGWDGISPQPAQPLCLAEAINGQASLSNRQWLWVWREKYYCDCSGENKVRNKVRLGETGEIYRGRAPQGLPDHGEGLPPHWRSMMSSQLTTGASLLSYRSFLKFSWLSQGYEI